MRFRISWQPRSMINLLWVGMISFIGINGCSRDESGQNAHKNTSTFKIDKEMEYLDLRNNYIKYFKGVEDSIYTDKISKQENDSLQQLENKLKDILKECHIANISEEGGINLETLFEGTMGFGNLDGLRVYKDSMTFFCTSKKLFNLYFEKNKLNPFDNLSSNELTGIFQSAFISDAVLTDFTSFKMTAPKGFIAYGMLGDVAQDVGPILPYSLFVLVFTEGYVYMAEADVKFQIKGIPECKTIWDRISSKSEDTAWDKYCKCYQKTFKMTGQFSKVQKRLEEMTMKIEH
jgi:hypothetical protein